MRFFRLGVVFAITSMPIAAAQAAAVDPAQAPVQTLCDRLIAIMKGGKQLGFQGRKSAIEPVVDQVFDLPLMIRLAVGSQWTSFSPTDQSALLASFRRMTVAQYAANFDSFNGNRFALDPKIEARGADRLVRTTLIATGEAPVPIAYRLRQNGGDWKIIDVYYQNSISQLATRRSDFAGALASGGAPALIKHLDALANKARS